MNKVYDWLCDPRTH